MALLRKLKALLSRLFGRKAPEQPAIPAAPVLNLPKIIRVSSFKSGKREFFVPDDVGEIVSMESLVFAHQYYAPKGKQRLPLFFKNPNYPSIKLSKNNVELENAPREFQKVPRGKVVS